MAASLLKKTPLLISAIGFGVAKAMLSRQNAVSYDLELEDLDLDDDAAAAGAAPSVAVCAQPQQCAGAPPPVDPQGIHRAKHFDINQRQQRRADRHAPQHVKMAKELLKYNNALKDGESLFDWTEQKADFIKLQYEIIKFQNEIFKTYDKNNYIPSYEARIKANPERQQELLAAMARHAKKAPEEIRKSDHAIKACRNRIHEACSCTDQEKWSNFVSCMWDQYKKYYTGTVEFLMKRIAKQTKNMTKDDPNVMEFEQSDIPEWRQNDDW